MSYSNQIKILEIEPVYATPSRAEFRLPVGKLYTNNIHLANLGVTKSAASAGLDGDSLNKLVGVYGSIKQISIMDGNIELQTLTRANEWLAFKSHLHSNSYNEDIAPSLSGNKKSNRQNNRDLSIKVSPDGGTTLRTSAAVATNQVSIVGSKLVEGGVDIQHPQVKMLETSEASTFKGQLDLAEALSFIQSVPYLDSEYFKNLKIVVEFDQNMVGEAGAAVLGGGMGTGVVAQVRPLLICEEITTQNVVEQMLGKTPKPFSYKVIENDVFRVPELVAPAPATSSPAKQATTYHVSSFNNKSVGRCVIMTRTGAGVSTIQGAAAVMYGPYNSHSMYHQKNQVRVNGRNLFARDGITRENQRLALMADTWGAQASITPFQNGIAFTAADADLRSDYIEAGNEAIGTCDYFGWDLDNNVISDLQIDYERRSYNGLTGGNDTATTVSKYNQSLDLVLFGEVSKQLIPTPSGSYNVVYSQ